MEIGSDANTITALDVEGDPRQVIAGDWAWLYQEGGMAALKEFLIASTDIDETLLVKYEFKSADLAADGTAITGYALKNGHPRGYLVSFDEAPFSMAPTGSSAPTPEPASFAIGVLMMGLAFVARRRTRWSPA